MAHMKISLKGAEYFLNSVRDKMIADTVTIRLYQNNWVPAATDILADYTEATFAGYTPVIFNDWNPLSILGTFCSIDAPTKGFAATGGPANSIYGYYVTDVTGLILLWAQRDDAAPITMSTLGHQYFVTPTLTSRSLYA